jgi:hypothetical protein
MQQNKIINSLSFLEHIDTCNHWYLSLRSSPIPFLSCDKLKSNDVGGHYSLTLLEHLLRTIFPEAASRCAACTIARRAKSIASFTLRSSLKESFVFHWCPDSLDLPIGCIENTVGIDRTTADREQIVADAFTIVRDHVQTRALRKDRVFRTAETIAIVVP